MILVAGAHPVLAIHYCSDNLASINLTEMTQQSHTCCGKNELRSSESNQTNTQPIPSFDNQKNGCCTYKNLKLSTDDFNNQSQHLNLEQIIPTLIVGYIALYSILNTFDFDNSNIVKHVFPPEGLGKLNLDLLSYICTYRI